MAASATHATDPAPRPAPKRKSWTLFILRMIAAGIVGAAIAMGVIQLIERDIIGLGDYLPIALCVGYAILGLTVWFNPYVRETRRTDERLWMRALAMLVMGVMLALPALAGPLGLDPVFAYALVAVLFIGQAWLGAVLKRKVDELTRQVMVDANNMSMAVFATLLFLYAAAERLGLTGGLSAWTINAVLWLVQFLVAQWAWMRRGVGNTPLAKPAE